LTPLSLVGILCLLLPFGMSEQEHRPQPIPETGQPSDMVGLIRVGSGSVTVWERDSMVLLQATNNQGEVILSSLLPRVLFDGGGLTGNLPVQEASLVPELPIIRIEGNIGRSPEFRTSKEKEHRGQPELYMRLAYHPYPQKREETTWYDVFLWGDAARGGRALDLRGGQPVQLVGKHKRYTRMVKPRAGGDPVEREFNELYVSSPDDIVKLRRLPRTMEETPQPKP
jgi:hypothetical protein